MLERVRELRQNATEAEAFLWELLRDRHLGGYKFRRQHPMGGYILEFYCHEARLAVEIDGAVHKEPEQVQHDAERTTSLNEQGITVIRFWNHEVLHATNVVLQKILEQIQTRSSLQPLPSPSGSTPADGTVRPSPVGRRDGDEGRFLRITPEGKPATGKPGELIIPADDEERLVLARRLVADRCIYGVDKNPLAVEIAKLSIWLTTMDNGRPFTFLDHALKCGDSLVGADEDMYRKWAFSLKGAQFTLYLTTLEELTAAARQKRKELESFTVLDVRDAEHKAELLKEADAAMARVKLGCDLLVGVRLLGLKPAEQESMLSHLLWDYVAGLPMDTPGAQRALHAARKEHAFHWPFEFPEVFERGGFDAFVGNPPFMGGTKISTFFGSVYADYLKSFYPSFTGNADLCALFFLRTFQNKSKKGTLGLIATKTISQGNTSETGLGEILLNGGIIFNANTSTSWPGSAAVIVSIIFITDSSYSGEIVLNEKKVGKISHLLSEVVFDWEPKELSANQGISYNGSKLDGIGFVIEPNEAIDLLSKSPKNKDILYPFLGGADLNNQPDQKPTRWVINFSELPYEKAKEYPDCLQIVQKRVYPSRQNHGEKRTRENWWQFTRVRNELYQSLNDLQKTIVISQATKYIQPSLVDTGIIFDQALVIFASQSYGLFAMLNSTIHSSWALEYQTSLGTTPYYIPTKAFLPFCFPQTLVTLDKIGKEYHEFRCQIMLSQMEGLTASYNRFHNSKEKSTDIARLRELHVEMDNAVATAYGWSDLDLGHGFHETPQGVRFTISEAARREVLARLLQLNHERYEEEVRQGLHEKDKKKAKEGKPARRKPKKLAQPEGQMNLLAVPDVPDGVEPVEALPPTPTSEIGSWDRCKCLACGKTVMGFSIVEHTQSEHQGKDPGYRKVGG